MKPIKELTTEEVREIISRQNWLDNNVAEFYDEYYKKISVTEWWQINLWDKMLSLSN